MDPARADHLRSQLIQASMLILDKVLTDVQAAGGSTASASERLLLLALRPTLPRLRSVLLSRLSAADPAGLEAVMGATATAIESILYQAPGEPLPRRRFEWTADGALILIPIEETPAT
jgi:hypothetical protein